MTTADVSAVVALQKSAFPPPFREDYHWDPEHILSHLTVFSAGQWVAEEEGEVVGSCSNSIISDAAWQAHGSWYETVGGPDIRGFDPHGNTLYGLDITVHPSVRRQGIGRAFYNARFDLIRSRGLTRYGTGCRMPDYLATSGGLTVEEHAAEVVAGRQQDRTLTPLLRYGLRFVTVVRDYMDDEESANAGALLEWLP